MGVSYWDLIHFSISLSSVGKICHSACPNYTHKQVCFIHHDNEWDLCRLSMWTQE